VTQKAVAAEVGVRPEYISRLEKGKIPRPREEIVDRLMGFIGHNLRAAAAWSAGAVADVETGQLFHDEQASARLVSTLLEMLAAPPARIAPSERRPSPRSRSDANRFCRAFNDWLAERREDPLYIVGAPSTRSLLPVLLAYLDRSRRPNGEARIRHLVGTLSSADTILPALEWKLGYDLRAPRDGQDGRVEIRSLADNANLPGVTPGAALAASSDGSAALLLPAPSSDRDRDPVEIIPVSDDYAALIARHLPQLWEEADRDRLPQSVVSIAPVSTDEASRAEAGAAFDGALVDVEAGPGERLVVKHELSSLLFPLGSTAHNPPPDADRDVWAMVARRRGAEFMRHTRVAQFHRQLGSYLHRDIVSRCGIEGLAFESQAPKDTRIPLDVSTIRGSVFTHLRDLLVDYENYHLAIVDQEDEPTWMENVFWEVKGSHVFLECWFDNDLDGIAWWDIHLYHDSVASEFRTYFDSLWREYSPPTKARLVKDLEQIIEKLRLLGG
jgi:transcriptional regulator with XRE-family HTH domain